MEKQTILIVDDDRDTLMILKSALSGDGYKVIQCTSGEEALAALERRNIQLAVLDVGLPGIDGFDTLNTIRRHPLYGDLPILMLTCHDSEIDHVLGLEMGADDYLGKPIRCRELLARIKAILRRTASKNIPNHLIVVGSLEVDPATRLAFYSGYDLKLSYKEFEILALLAKRPGQVFSRQEILDRVWSEDFFYETRTIDVHIRRIRKKAESLGLQSDFIETVRNVGYRLSAASTSLRASNSTNT
jgi:DNA-binding response OmpR family regulator